MLLCSLRNTNSSDRIVRLWKRIFGGGWKTLHIFFKLLCIVATTALVIWCCWEFGKDEDVCEVLFKRFREDEESIYPALMFTMRTQFNETVLRAYDKSFNGKKYERFLHGFYRDEKMLDIDYDKVNMQLKDYLLEACVYESILDKVEGKCKKPLFVSRQNTFGVSHFTMHLPLDRDVVGARIKLKRSIFKNGIGPVTGYFYVQLIFPYQSYFSDSSSGLASWPLRTKESTKNYIMSFTLQGMDVLQRRQKKHKPCYELEDYDSEIRDAIIEKSGCRLITWVTNRSEPLCTTKKSLHDLLTMITDTAYRKNGGMYKEPCRSIEKTKLQFTELDIQSATEPLEDKEDGWVAIDFSISNRKFTEIKQVRKYDYQSLIGNAGGYIGIWLGYAIWNVPTIIVDAWKYMKSIYSQEQSLLP